MLQQPVLAAQLDQKDQQDRQDHDQQQGGDQDGLQVALDETQAAIDQPRLGGDLLRQADAQGPEAGVIEQVFVGALQHRWQHPQWPASEMSQGKAGGRLPLGQATGHVTPEHAVKLVGILHAQDDIAPGGQGGDALLQIQHLAIRALQPAQGGQEQGTWGLRQPGLERLQAGAGDESGLDRGALGQFLLDLVGDGAIGGGTVADDDDGGPRGARQRLEQVQVGADVLFLEHARLPVGVQPFLGVVVIDAGKEQGNFREAPGLDLKPQLETVVVGDVEELGVKALVFLAQVIREPGQIIRFQSQPFAVQVLRLDGGREGQGFAQGTDEAFMLDLGPGVLLAIGVDDEDADRFQRPGGGGGRQGQ